MKRTLTILVGLLAILLGAPARASDAPPSPEDLLRKARTAESADRDVAKAIELYEAALAAAKGPTGTTVGRDAALRLLDLREARGEGAEALRIAVRLWVDFGPVLTPEHVPVVRAALARLLPAGQSVTGPHGTIVVDSPGRGDALSPLERTILEQMRSLKGLDGDRRLQRESETEAALRSVGREALPALEKAIRNEGPDVAPFAARLYAQLGGVEAFPVLESLLRGPDPFTRAAAAEAVGHVTWDEKDRDAWMAGILRLLDLPALASEREALRMKVARESTGEEEYARAKAGGADADFWLDAAIRDGHPPAIEEAIQRAKAGQALSEALVQALGGSYGASPVRYTPRGVVTQLQSSEFTAEDRLLMLDLLAAQAPSKAALSASAAVAAACLHDPRGAAGPKAASLAWRRALGVEDPALRQWGALALANLGVPAPPEVVRESTETYAHVLARDEGLFNQPYAVFAVLGPSLHAEPALWKAVALALEEARVDTTLGRVAQAVTTGLAAQDSGQPQLPPAEADALWVPLLDRVSAADRLAPGGRVVDWLYTAAARSNDARFVEWVRRTAPKESRVHPAMGTLSGFYRGPGRTGLALDGLTDVRFAYDALLRAEARTTEFWDGFFARAPAWTGAELRGALERLNASLDPLSNLALGNRASLATRAKPFGPDPWWSVAARPAWIPLLRRPDYPWGEGQNRHAGAARLGAASGSPEFLALVRERTTGPTAAWNDPGTSILLNALVAYAAPFPVAWLADLLKDPTLPPYYAQQVFALLAMDGSPEARTRIVGLAKDPAAPAAPFALADLVPKGDRDTVLSILSAWTPATTDWPQAYRRMLVLAAASLKLREAIPFLLAQYQGDLEAEAAKALDTIRAYHERLATFQSWAKDLAEGRRDLSKLLADPDPEIRRAAVLSLGALGDRDALPTLVRIAKEEKDPQVRAAALEAVERIARSPSPSPPAPKSD